MVYSAIKLGFDGHIDVCVIEFLGSLSNKFMYCGYPVSREEFIANIGADILLGHNFTEHSLSVFRKVLDDDVQST